MRPAFSVLFLLPVLTALACNRLGDGTSPTPTAPQSPTSYVMLAAGSLTYVREPGYANPLNPTDSAEAMVASWPGQTITYICANSQGQLKNVTWDEDGKKTTCNVDVQLPVGVDIELSTLDIVKAEAGYPRSGVRGKMQYLYGTLLTNIVNNPDHSQAAKFRLNTAGQLN